MKAERRFSAQRESENAQTERTAAGRPPPCPRRNRAPPGRARREKHVGLQHYELALANALKA
jgi:hypothetical protein